MNQNHRRNPLSYAAAAVLLLCVAAFFLRRDVSKPREPQGSSSVVGPTAEGVSNRASTVAVEKDVELHSMLQELSRNPDSQLEAERILSGMTSADLIRKLEAIWREEPEESKADVALQLLQELAERDPDAAATWIAARKESRTQIDGLKAVAATWAGSNPIAAAQWVRQLTGEQRISGIVAVGYESASTKPAEALWLAAELAPGPQRDDLIEYVIREWVAVNTNAPLTWAMKLEEPSMREQVMASAAVSLGDRDPVAAAKLAIEQIPPGKKQNDAVIGIVQRWAQQDARKAADWVINFPQGQLRAQALQNLVHLWGSKSLEETAVWLNELEDGAARDVAISAYSELVAPSAQKTAIVWAESISDPKQRQRQIDHLTEQWTTTEGEPEPQSIGNPAELFN